MKSITEAIDEVLLLINSNLFVLPVDPTLPSISMNRAPFKLIIAVDVDVVMVLVVALVLCGLIVSLREADAQSGVPEITIG